MEGLTRAVLVAAGIVHLLPTAGLLGARQLQRLYGVALDHPDLIVLMRHRALLFALLGIGLIAAVAWPSLRTAMLLAGLVSTAGFCVLAATQPELGGALRRVAWIDLPIALGLAFVLVQHVRTS